MKQLARAFALTGALALAVPAAPVHAAPSPPAKAPAKVPGQTWDESYEARQSAAIAVRQAREEMRDAFGRDTLKNGDYVWKKDAEKRVTKVVISRPDQMAYAYQDGEMIAASTISSGKESKPTPPGIFPIMEKRRHHRSNKYDDAPMPYMQRLDTYGIAMHAGHLPGYPASHGCVRLPEEFAARLFAATSVGTPVLIA
ncbi:L,D-transpeptidase family protein [Altericroceibacterium xinjiangense]|uniref:L,D-transpeptidase family protein n=1 Tax=Altericroceibacterium xinjiangense TaxID=762261 RepID=UPI000F7E7807|nr:L,D-transpeptidase family protein [Altericroceibacterium xinjiangense]